jgi:hypothetical protein
MAPIFSLFIERSADKIDYIRKLITNKTFYDLIGFETNSTFYDLKSRPLHST